MNRLPPRRPFLVYCEDSSHPGKRVKVETLHMWGVALVGRTQPLVGDASREDLPLWEIDRHRCRFECKLCSATLTVRLEHLSPLVWKLLEEGVSELSLSGLQWTLDTKQ